ncbi:MAG: 30S ribosomal protein S13 [Dehalococcoidales bacterium]|nr:30S ribosomal protein S13 [Dehalococcoidales bacterium]
MARIAGIDIPRNKQVWVSLQYIFGIGPTLAKKVLAEVGISPEIKVSDLTDAQVNTLREAVAKYEVEGELRKEISLNIKRLIEIGSRRGQRHRRSLPVRGQRSRTNARTGRGQRKTVAGRGQKRGSSKK